MNQPSPSNPPGPLRANLDEWTERIRRSDPRAIAQAITAIENGESIGESLLQRLFGSTGRATLLGITGAPGTGKSTLVDAVALALRRRGQAVGILAVDPSSPFSGGAILGDRVRMQAHDRDPGIFIRSMATRGAMGGLAAATVDAAMVLDAAGMDWILIETVGVGQDELEIARVADTTLLLLAPAMGDAVQALKAGVMEIADIFVLNKSDTPGVDRLEEEIRATLALAPSPPPMQPALVRTVAFRAEGVEELVAAIDHYLALARASGSFDHRRVAYWSQRIRDTVQNRLIQRFLPPTRMEDDLGPLAEAVAARSFDPVTAAEQLLGSMGPIALDHVGVAVNSLDDALALYQNLLGMQVSGIETIAPEKTKVALLPLAETRIELLEATTPDSPIARFLAKRGPGLHHICLRVPDLAAAVARLKQNGARLINEVPGTGAGDHKYVFIHPASAGGVLLELVETANERPD